MKKTVAAFALFFTPLGFAAEPSDGILACAAQSDKEKRLECYDALADAVSPPITASGGGKGKWVVQIDTNPIDDSRTVTMILRSDAGVARFGDPIALVIRCKSNKTEMYINWSSYLGSEANVLTRIGDATAQTRTWGLSTDSQATFNPEGLGGIKQLVGQTKYVAQVTPYSESPITAVFDLTGIDEAIKPLRETCSW